MEGIPNGLWAATAILFMIAIIVIVLRFTEGPGYVSNEDIEKLATAILSTVVVCGGGYLLVYGLHQAPLEDSLHAAESFIAIRLVIGGFVDKESLI